MHKEQRQIAIIQDASGEIKAAGATVVKAWQALVGNDLQQHFTLVSVGYKSSIIDVTVTIKP